MATPINHGFPVRRPNFISLAQFVGNDDRLDLEMQYTDITGNPQTFTLPLERNPVDPEDLGALCLPSSKTINDLDQDALIAHLRMSTLIGRTIPGSDEWKQAFINQSDANNLQTAIGTVKVLGVAQVTDEIIQVSLQKASSGPIRVIDTDYGELGQYSFVPTTQLLVVSGAIEAQYPSYIHNPSVGTVLSASQRNNIIDYVQNLDPWI